MEHILHVAEKPSLAAAMSAVQPWLSAWSMRASPLVRSADTFARFPASAKAINGLPTSSSSDWVDSSSSLS
jgi:hypothetical protein